MYIHNVRYGFATNSSSSHSIILMNDGETAHDNLDYQEFGWDFFTAASEEAKRGYMGQVAKQALCSVHRLSSKDAAIIASEWVGTEVDPEGYIDHQSLISIPCDENYGTIQINKDYFDDMLKFILQPNIVIGGGNDNTEDVHPILDSGRGRNVIYDRWDDEEIGNPALRLLTDYGSETVRARYDSEGKFWSLFNVSSGTKIRTSFVPDANAEKSEVPELVDVKITDMCDRNCHYCYQGSTPDGEHADKYYIGEVASALGRLQTFEVAIGGGEPTTHPEFIKILREFQSSGVRPNFSTRNADWVVEHWPEIKNIVGGVGLSVDHSCYLLNHLSKLHNLEGLKLTVHIVVGACSEHEFEEIMNLCKTFGVTVLLLGWKNTHRGKDGPSYPDFDLKSALDKFWGEQREFPSGEKYIPWNGPHVAFDTVLVQEMKEWLESHANRWSFTTREGAHSMYIDCVEQKMARSSYEDDGTPTGPVERYQRNTLGDNIKAYFATL